MNVFVLLELDWCFFLMSGKLEDVYDSKIFKDVWMLDYGKWILLLSRF